MDLLRNSEEYKILIDVATSGWRNAGLFCFGVMCISYLIIILIYYILEPYKYYRNIKQIMRRFEMQGILGIEITYHEGEFYITYLDIEICKRDLLKGLLFLEELLYYKDLFQPPKHIKAGIKFHYFINDLKDKITRKKLQ